MAREADEEIGVLVKTDDLRLVHILHQHTTSGRVALFFEATDWTGEITNREPDKCVGWTFVDPARASAQIVPYIAHALWHVDAGAIYSERGWS